MSMQVVARARERGIEVRVRELFEHQTIAALAAACDLGHSSSDETHDAGDGTELSPIQEWFFEQGFSDPEKYCHAYAFEPKQSINLKSFQQALGHVIMHHTSLRRYFADESGHWESAIGEPASDAVLPSIEITDSSEAAIQAQLEQCAIGLQRQIDLRTGRLLCAQSLESDDGSVRRIVIVAHHLAVDAYSWSILLDDLSTAYRQTEQGESVRLPGFSSSYDRWVSRLHAAAASAEFDEDRRWWRSQPPNVAVTLPRDNNPGAKQNTLMSMEVVTSKIADPGGNGEGGLLHMPMEDVLITALCQALATWTGQADVSLALEHFGRIERWPDIDLSRTIGWCTTLYPLTLTVPQLDALGALRSIQKQRQDVPSHGLAYGVIRYLTREPEFQSSTEADPQCEVSFNYLGQLGKSPAGSSLLRPAADLSLAVNRSENVRPFVLEFAAWIEAGSLWVSVHLLETLARAEDDRSTCGQRD